MVCYEETSCRVVIQLCVGLRPDGRKRHRSFSIRGLRPGAPDGAIAAIVRALAPLLEYPITKVTKMVKRKLVFGEPAAPSPAALSLALPEPALPEPPLSEAALPTATVLVPELADDGEDARALLATLLLRAVLYGWACGNLNGYRAPLPPFVHTSNISPPNTGRNIFTARTA